MNIIRRFFINMFYKKKKLPDKNLRFSTCIKENSFKYKLVC